MFVFRYSYTNETEFYLLLALSVGSQQRVEKNVVISSIRFKIHSDFPNATTWSAKVSRERKFNNFITIDDEEN